MLQLLFFLKSYFIRRRLLSSTTLGRQHTPLHNLIMTQTELGVAQCGHSPDLLYTSSLRVKPVVVNPRKILCTFFFYFVLVYMVEKKSRFCSTEVINKSDSAPVHHWPSGKASFTLPALVHESKSTLDLTFKMQLFTLVF